MAHLTRSLRKELGPRGVRVKNVEPGVVATELGDGMSDETGRAMLAEHAHADRRRSRRATSPTRSRYAAAAPPRMNVAELVVVPTAQG